MIFADGMEDDRFLDGQTLTAKVLDTGASVPLAQTGPGHYEARVSSNNDGLAAVVVRDADGGELVARVQAAAVETSEWPATVEVAELPAGAVVLDAGGGGGLWVPRGTGVGLVGWFWVVAAAAALGAVWTRK